MARRTIVTSQPEVACDVCARRLLRGEHSEIFLAGGRRCNVCELCAPRAAHEGWLREVDHDPLSHATLRPRRGRSLLGRLRKGVQQELRPGPASSAGEPYDFLGGAANGAEREPGGDILAAERPGVATGTRRAVSARPAARVSSSLQAAIDIFNAGEYPRRLAGVARSLGVPEVSIHHIEQRSAEIGIVVAWELCWYRYAVDVHEDRDARVLAQGTTLEELSPQERSANGSIDERGALSLASA
jgi:hypothetical protein